MSISYEGMMLVGCTIEDVLSVGSIKPNEDNEYFWEDFVEKHGMKTASPWYDADEIDCFIGYLVEDAYTEGLDQTWLDDLKEKGKKFEKITDVKAQLSGLCDIC